jgi:Flp pilus assembly protein TadB
MRRIEAIEADPVINELLDLGRYDKQSNIPILGILKEHRMQLIAVAAAFLLGFTVGFVKAMTTLGIYVHAFFLVLALGLPFLVLSLSP